MEELQSKVILYYEELRESYLRNLCLTYKLDFSLLKENYITNYYVDVDELIINGIVYYVDKMGLLYNDEFVQVGEYDSGNKELIFY
jgi:hypothetical protein